MRIGVIVIPPVFGMLVDNSGSYSVGWIITSCIALVSTIFMLLFVRDAYAINKL